MDTILVATDFSQAAGNAVEYAVRFAMRLNAQLYLLHVSQAPAIIGDVPMKDEEAEIREKAGSKLKEQVEIIKTETAGKVTVDTELRIGDFNEELESATEVVKPSLVVIGNPEKSALDRFFFGNHTVHTVKHLRCPVLTIPPERRFSGIHRIAMVYDSGLEIDPLDSGMVSGIVKAFHAELHLIQIGEKSGFIASKATRPGALHAMVKNIGANYHFITVENSYTGIVDFTEKNRIDLLILWPGIQGSSEDTKDRIYNKQFILHSHLPVLSI